MNRDAMITRQLYRTPTLWLLAIVMLLTLGILPMAGCGVIAPLAQIVQPPRFEQDDRPAEVRVIGPSRSYPAGGAGLTIWIRVTNPNPFGFTLSTLDTTLLIEGNEAATGDFPLGLPLTAGGSSVVPIDLTISFADVPALAGVIGPAARGDAISYQLDGTVGIDAGRFGQPTFGPMLLARGELRIAQVR
jgi:Late embryogenesis abundant protein